MFWWPAPGNFALLLILTEVLLSPTASQTLRATTLYQASCCYSLTVSIWGLQSLLCVCPRLLSEEHRWAPHTFQSRALLFLHRQQSCRKEWDKSVLRCSDVWASHAEKFNSCNKIWLHVSICRLYISCIFFPCLKFIIAQSSVDL